MAENNQTPAPKISLGSLQVLDASEGIVVPTVKVDSATSGTITKDTPLISETPALPKVLPSVAVENKTEKPAGPAIISLATLQVHDHSVHTDIKEGGGLSLVKKPEIKQESVVAAVVTPVEKKEEVVASVLEVKQEPPLIKEDPKKVEAVVAASPEIKTAESTLTPDVASAGTDSQSIGSTPIKEAKKAPPVPVALKLDMANIGADFTILGDHITEENKAQYQAVKAETLEPTVVKVAHTELFKNYENSFQKRREMIMKQLKRMKKLAKTNFTFIFSAILVTSLGVFLLSFLDPNIHNVQNYKISVINGYHQANNTVSNFKFGELKDSIAYYLKDGEDVLKSQQDLTDTGATSTGTRVTTVMDHTKLPEADRKQIRKEKIKDYFIK